MFDVDGVEMAISKVTARTWPGWRRVVSVLINVYLVIATLEYLFVLAFTIPSGSMDLQAGTEPGIILSGTFTYPFHNVAKGRTVDIPVTAPLGYTDPGHIVRDTNVFSEFTPTEESDLGPFGSAGRGYVNLPRGVHLDRELNGTAVLQPLRTGARQELSVDSPVGWRGRLLVALPTVLIWTGLWVAQVMFGTFLRSIVQGQPFHPKNPSRLAWLAGALATVVAADSWLRVWIVRAVLDVLGNHGHPIPLHVGSPGINSGPIVVIIGLLFLAAAFRGGRRMAADLEGLV